MSSQTTSERRRNVLPMCVTPTDYHLHITPNFNDFSFKGTVRIHVKTSACGGEDQTAHPDVCAGEGGIKAIKLNYNDMTFDKVTVVNAATKQEEEVPASAVVYDEANLTASIPLQTPLQPGQEASLAIDYTGCMNDKLVGFYRSKYKNAKGEEIYMGTTQFESVDARRAFPCWDEPAVKAVFHITITAPAHMTSISNTEVVRSEPSADGQTITYTYAPTPKMSTYLVAWVIGELESIQAKVRLPYSPDRDTIVSLYAAPGQANKGQYSLELATRVLPLYEKFFEVGYPLNKMDMIAIPDFAAGAMENWGLITYRESAILVDASTTTVEKKYVALVVAHEIAHQWFGNAVTMSWWKELWLNEAFATYMEYVAVNKLIPEWSIFTEMLQREGGSAMQLDAMNSSHPVEVDVYNAQEIDDIFDAISYSKGSCIIRMIVEYIGEEAFQKGMSRYIAHFMYGNATTVDLWKFLGEAAGQDIAAIMADWTGKQGYPYLTVAPAAQGEGLAISQHRFLATKVTSGEEATQATNWSIPLLIGTPGGKETAVVVKGGANQVVSAVSPAKHAWVKVNSRQCGFCRVMYSEDMLTNLKAALHNMELDCLDRLGVVSDYAAFAKGGYASSVTVLELMQALAEKEDNLSVWTTIVEAESDIRHIVATKGDVATEKFNAFCQKLYRAAMDRLGYTPKPGESENEDQLRSLLFSRLVAAKDATTLEAARDLYANRATTPIPQNLLRAVFTVRVREGGAEALEEVKNLADTVEQLSDRHKYLASIAAACPATVSIAEVFDYCFSGKVRPGEVMYVLVGLVGKAELLMPFFEEMKSRWAKITEVLPPMLAGRVPKLLGDGADPAVATAMKAFYETLSEHDKMAIGRSFQQGLEALETNVAWAARDAEAIVNWL